MFEFRVARNRMPAFIKDSTSWDNAAAVKAHARAKEVRSTVARTNYTLDFNNMFKNINNVKPGCRSCRGTF